MQLAGGIRSNRTEASKASRQGRRKEETIGCGLRVSPDGAASKA